MKKTFVFFVAVMLISVAAIEAKKRKSKGRDRTCNRSCQGFRVKKSLCGSDGKTYKNFCLFNKARCKANKTGVSLTVEHTGSCRCSKVLPKCDQDGNSTKQAVCGSDNTTYESFCSFRVARCEAKQNKTRLTVLYKGECKKQKKTRVCPNLGQCYIKEQPVCGSDKKTYRNPCFFRVSKCIAKRQNQKLTIKKRGACGKRKPSKSCPKKCPTKYRPVCGADNKTYENSCLLSIAKCALPKKNRSSLQLQYNGPCSSPTTPKPCPRWEDCKIVRKPVCGSDGKTYPNLCVFRITKCLARRNEQKPLKLKYKKACRKRKNKKDKRKEKKKKGGKKNGKGKSGSKGKNKRGD